MVAYLLLYRIAPTIYYSVFNTQLCMSVSVCLSVYFIRSQALLATKGKEQIIGKDDNEDIMSRGQPVYCNVYYLMYNYTKYETYERWK